MDESKQRERPTSRWEDDFGLALAPYRTRVTIYIVKLNYLEQAYVERPNGGIFCNSKKLCTHTYSK